MIKLIFGALILAVTLFGGLGPAVPDYDYSCGFGTTTVIETPQSGPYREGDFGLRAFADALGLRPPIGWLRPEAPPEVDPDDLYCYPNSILAYPEGWPMGYGVFNVVLGGYEDEINIPGFDFYFHALYRDVERGQIWPLEIYGWSERSPCSEILGVCTAFLLGGVYRQIGEDSQRYNIWLTADHCSQVRAYDPDFYSDHWRIGGVDAFPIWHSFESQLALFVTPSVPGAWARGRFDLDADFYTWPSIATKDDIYVGEPIYIAGGTIVPTKWQGYYVTEILLTPYVLKGILASPYDVGFWGDFIIQTDTVGGFSGSPVFIVRDNGDGRINYKDFQLLGVVNAGWSSGNTISAIVPSVLREAIKEWMEQWPEFGDILEGLQAQTDSQKAD